MIYLIDSNVYIHGFRDSAGFFNDMLIAVSARELGAVILTENGEDFDIISSVLDIRYVEPWPELPPL
jgi:predicted nucleic acid-binding protein